MISHLQIDSCIIDNIKKKPISPSELNTKYNLLHRKLNMQTYDFITPQPRTSQTNSNLQKGLQKLLKTSPYATLIKQKSQQILLNQDSFSQNYHNGLPQSSQITQPFFKADLKSNHLNNSNSQNRKLQTSVKLAPKKSFDSSSQMTSPKGKEKQTIVALQALLVRTTNLLHTYKEQIAKYEQENNQLKQQLAERKSQEYEQNGN